MAKIKKGAWMQLGAPVKTKKVRKNAAAEALVYQIKVELKSSKPLIWRRLLLSAGTPLNVLHAYIQMAMGWEDCHLHLYKIGDDLYSSAAAEFGDALDEADYCLYQVAAKPKAKFIYDYDMGDGWQHQITVEKIMPADPGQKMPVCLDGAGACPPEDCGGLWGYYTILDAIEDPKHPEHDEMKGWLDEDFDPTAFDMEKVNKALKKMK